jgi:hypothetical protein
LAYIYHPLHRQRQYIIGVGDDGDRSNTTHTNTSATTATTTNNSSSSSSGSSSGMKTRAIEHLSIKVYSVDDWSHPLHSFPVLPPAALQALPSSADVSSFAVLADGSQISVGFTTGMVVLFCGAFLSDDNNALGKQVTGQLLQSAQIHPPEANSGPSGHAGPRYVPVSGLHFCELVSLRRTERRVRLYVVMDTERMAETAGPGGRGSGSGSSSGSGSGSGSSSSSSGGGCSVLLGSKDASALSEAVGIVVFDTSMVMTPQAALTLPSGGAYTPAPPGTFVLAPQGQRRAPHLLDERGAAPHCSSLARETCELIVGRAEGIFTYSVSGWESG